MQRTFTVAYAPPECRAPSSGSWTLTGNCNLKTWPNELQNRSVQIRDGANASFENCTFKLGLHGSFTAENANLTMLSESRIESSGANNNQHNKQHIPHRQYSVLRQINVTISGTSHGTFSNNTLAGNLYVYGADINASDNRMRGVLLRNAAKARITGNTIEGRAPLASGIGINIWRSEDIYAADNAIKGYIDVWSSNTSMSPGSCIQMLNSSAVIENTTAWDCSHSIETLLPSSVVLRDDTFSNISEFSPQTVATAYNSYLGALKGGYPASGAAYVSLVNSTYASIYGRDIYEYEPVVVKVVNSGGQGVAGVEVMITNGLGGVYATPY